MSDASTRGKRNRRHGNDSELMVAAWLRANGWPDACTTRSLSRGVQSRAGDIHGGPCVIEVKAVTASAWPTWLRQAQEEADGAAFIVVRRAARNTDVGTWPARFALRGESWMHAMSGDVVPFGLAFVHAECGEPR